MIDILIMTYNSEKTIERCLESVLAQTNNNYKIIVSDDHSGDNTVSLIKSKYPNIEIYTNAKNIGSGKNREQLAKYAKSEYVMYLDSDDYLENNYIAVVSAIIKKFNPDAIKTKQVVKHYEGEPYKLGNCIKIFHKPENIHKVLSLMYVSNVIFKRSLFQYVTWYGQRNCEDGCLVSQLSCHIKKLIKTDLTAYHWDRTTNGVSKHPNTANQLLDILHAHLLGDSIYKSEKMAEHIKKFADKIKKYHLNKYLKYIPILDHIYELCPFLDSELNKYKIKIIKT